MPTKQAAKKSAPKKAPAKKAPTKAPTKATAKKAAPATNKADAKAAEARRAERASDDARLTKEILSRRKKEETWTEISEALGISQGKAQLLLQRHEAGEPAQAATPARVKNDRDKGLMSWPAIAAKYGLNKAQVQKLYREAGGDPHASYIGKGGRYFGHEEKVSGSKTATTSKPKTAAASNGKAESRTTPTKLKPLFKEDADKDDVIARLSGKKIQTKLTEKFGGGLSDAMKVGGEVKVGKDKSGTRVVQFHDGMKTRTVALTSIVKVGR